MKETIYVFVDKDLDKPQQTVQACHAILESKQQFTNHPYIIVFGLSTKKMHKVAKDLEERGFHITQFFEPDLGYRLTSFCTDIIDRNEYMRKYQLLK